MCKAHVQSNRFVQFLKSLWTLWRLKSILWGWESASRLVAFLPKVLILIRHIMYLKLQTFEHAKRTKDFVHMCKLSADHEEPNFYYATQDVKENWRKFSWKAARNRSTLFSLFNIHVYSFDKFKVQMRASVRIWLLETVVQRFPLESLASLLGWKNSQVWGGKWERTNHLQSPFPAGPPWEPRATTVKLEGDKCI